MAYEFYLGIDAPSDEEKVTVSLVEKENEDETGQPEEVEYRVREMLQLDLEREDGDVNADPVADRIQTIIADEPFIGRTILVVNRTNEEGQAVLDTLQEHGLTSFGVILTGEGEPSQEGSGVSLSGGDDAGRDEASFYVGEDTLVEVVNGLYRRRRFYLQQNNDHASAVADDLERYKSAIDAAEAGDEQAGQPVSSFNAFTRGVGLACWLGEQHDFDPTTHLADFQPTTGEAKREMRPDTD